MKYDIEDENPNMEKKFNFHQGKWLDIVHSNKYANNQIQAAEQWSSLHNKI